MFVNLGVALDFGSVASSANTGNGTFKANKQSQNDLRCNAHFTEGTEDNKTVGVRLHNNCVAYIMSLAKLTPN